MTSTDLTQTPKEQHSRSARIWNFCQKRPWTWKLATSIGLGTLTIGSTIVIATIVTRPDQPERITIPVTRPSAPERDLTWLADLDYCAPETGRTIADCLIQIRLWLDYARQIVTGEEALRYRAKASEFMSNAETQKCFQKPQLVCLGSFAGNINRDLERAYALPEGERNAALIGAISQYQALVDARLGSPKTAPAPSRGIILRIFEKAESDIALYLGTDPASNAALDTLGDFYEYNSDLPTGNPQANGEPPTAPSPHPTPTDSTPQGR